MLDVLYDILTAILDFLGPFLISVLLAVALVIVVLRRRPDVPEVKFTRVLADPVCPLCLQSAVVPTETCSHTLDPALYGKACMNCGYTGKMKILRRRYTFSAIPLLSLTFLETMLLRKRVTYCPRCQRMLRKRDYAPHLA